MIPARFLLTCALLASAGCGARVELGQVEGTVRAGGRPLANVVVRFYPDTGGGESKLPHSLAQTDEQGHYRLLTDTQKGGAVIGKHRVTVEDLAILSAPRSEDGTVLKRPPVRFAAGYSDPLRTPLMKEVKAGKQTIDLELSLTE